MAQGCSRLLGLQRTPKLETGVLGWKGRTTGGRLEPSPSLSSRHVPRSHAPKAAQEASNNKEETLQEDQQQQAAEEAVVEAPIE